MNDKAIQNYAEKNGISIQKAKKHFKLAEKAIGIVEDTFNPYDYTVETLTDEEILYLRTRCAEIGTELTPQEIKDVIEVIKLIRTMLRK